MNEERFKIVKRLLGEALEKNVTQREPWLREVVDGDDDLFREVAALLRAPDAGSMDLAGRMSVVIKEDLEGLKLGPWRLVRELGQGGMGTVWLAARDDESFEMMAAVKLVARERLYPELVGRFRRERQILANLTHPNIAGLLDGGTTTDGRPYLVMEFVDGMAVDQWCAQVQPTREKIVELVHCLCEALAYAHRKGVIHRDIKCSNVMVDGSGHVKLMDFGIARLVDHSAQRDLSLTASGETPMTPEFAAPEQLAGRMATRQSDIHGLGLVLFQLLTGLRPRELGQSAYDALNAPILPHTRVFADAPEPLPPALRRILRSALAPGLQDRYGSVEQMSQALDSWLNQPNELNFEPTDTHSPKGVLTWNTLPAFEALVAFSERSNPEDDDPIALDAASRMADEPIDNDPVTPLSQGSFRYKLAVAMLSMVIIGLVSLLLTTRRQLSLEQQYQEFLTESNASEQRSAQVNAAADWAQSLERRAYALMRRNDVEPEVRARLQAQLGQEFQLIGKGDRAEVLTQGAYATWRDLSNANGMSDTLEQLTWLEWSRGGDNQALATADEAAQLSRKLDPVRQVRALRSLAWMQYSNGDLLNAAATLDEALALKTGNSFQARTLTADCMTRLGQIRRVQQRYPEAERWLRSALHQWRELQGPMHPRVADSLEQLGLTLQGQHKYSSALPLVREALAIRRTFQDAGQADVVRLTTALNELETTMRTETQAGPL